MTAEQISMFAAADTLAKARREFEAKVDDGATCPCCEQFTKRYRRTILGTMAACLIVLHKSEEPLTAQQVNASARHIKTVNPSADMAKLRYWGLIVEDGGHRWRITEHGREFVNRERTVPQFAVVYDRECKAMEGGQVTIDDALGARFDRDELMSRGG